jgi:hypothetical protein
MVEDLFPAKAPGLSSLVVPDSGQISNLQLLFSLDANDWNIEQYFQTNLHGVFEKLIAQRSEERPK